MFDIWGTAKKIRLVPAVIFVYDCSRLYFLVLLLELFLRSRPDLGGNAIPLTMYAVPNALFLVMSFFLLFRFEAFKAYVPLYVIGKSLCILCIMVWVFFASRQVSGLREIMWAVYLCAADAGTIAGTILQKENLLQNSAVTATTAEGEA